MLNHVPVSARNRPKIKHIAGEDDEVKINTCVVRKEKGPGNYEYYVFMTTNIGLSAKQIIMYYQDRPEIEEDYNQLKNDWGIKEFQSTKYVEIIFHISRKSSN